METGSQFKILIQQTGEAGDRTPATSSLQGEWFIHYTAVAPILLPYS